MGEIKVACVGDIMCGDSFYSLGCGVASSLRKYGNEFLCPEIVNLLSAHDLVLCNIEGVLSDLGCKEYSLRSLHMRGRPETAQYLKNWGINVANVANNHILEHGHACAIDTVRQLHKARIKTVGAGRNGNFQPGVQVTELKFHANTIIVLGMCFLEEKYAYYGGGELNELWDRIRSLSVQGKTVIVSIHWGDEFIDRPTLSQRTIGRQLINVGASLVIGHHAHVVQGVENLNGGLIAYSLGNFIFDCFLEHTKWSGILSVTLSDGKIIKWHFVPIEKDKEHRPILVQGNRKKELEKKFKARCNLLQLKTQPELYKKQYQFETKALETAAKRKLWLELVKRMPSLRLIYWPQLFLRPIKRRLGMW